MRIYAKRHASGSRPHVPVSRREFLRTAASGTAGIAAWSLSARAPAASAAERTAVQETAHAAEPGTPQPASAKGPAASIVPFDAGWLFGRFVTGSDQRGFDDSALETVTLPHTVAPLSWQNWDPSTWEQVWIYRKHFDAPVHTEGLRLFLDFQGTITQSTVTLNGNVVTNSLAATCRSALKSPASCSRRTTSSPS